jgi:hypothetical protein
MSESMSQDPRNVRSEANDPARRLERERIGVDIAARLADRGVSLSGEESSEELVTLLEVVERFEHAVQARDGDLMVDEGRPDADLQPDNPSFVIPRRAADESVSRYVRRVEEAISGLQRS